MHVAMAPVQLGRNVRPLLKIVGGQPRKKDVKPMEEPEDVTAPPIDTEEDETDEPDFGDPHYDMSDDEPPRAIVHLTKSKHCGWSRDDNYYYPECRDASTTPSPKTNSTGSPILGCHIGDGFLVDRKVKPPKAGYGKKAGRTADALNGPGETTPRRKFERVKSMTESASPRQTKRFNVPISGSEASSPAKSPSARRGLKATDKEEESSSLSDIDSEEALSDPPRPSKSRGQGQKQKKEIKRQPKKSTKNRSRELSADEDISQRPEFRMPDGYDDFASTTELAGIDMPLYTDAKPDKKAHLGADEAACPMCDEPVDKQWLSEYSKGQRMSISRQAKFCHLHKKRSAKKLWEAKGYPEVDWGQLEARIRSHRDYLESLINGAPSHFGEQLREKIRTGRNRTLFKTDDYPIPGYYGLRGMSAMTESIVDTFSSLLRERAPRDRLISARGHTGYVQAVLVPELGVRLIKEDMGIGDDGEARAVMRESQAVGVILNDEKGEARGAPQAVAQAAFGGDDQVDGAASGVNSHNTSGTDGESEHGGKVDLRIQRVDDSDSDLSSLASLGDQRTKAPGKGPADNSDSKLASLVSLGKTSEPLALGRDDVEDSDSDLSSLASLDKL
ncbi:hypothetical protein N8I77_004583 [Diaporthe amygdali]|uniref:Restriction of telomere capping protein 4 n=1 Tax=Phomopsis amygdali TaxID=1214568 RepID=A0AAD9SK38_PHOAM|nr:hypothetical protein N8I77_004583 [Diaporthe amygdali]